MRLKTLMKKVTIT